jgi:hypothetical protein
MTGVFEDREARNPMDRVKAGRTLLLSMVVLLIAGATPAAAADGLPLSLAATKPWHFWAVPVLLASVVGLFFMTFVGYLVKVLAAKYGIRIGRRSAG